jgi:hypothetical protein
MVVVLQGVDPCGVVIAGKGDRHIRVERLGMSGVIS